MIGEPPVEVGAAHETVTLALPEVAVSDWATVGAVGGGEQASILTQYVQEEPSS